MSYMVFGIKQKILMVEDTTRNEMKLQVLQGTTGNLFDDVSLIGIGTNSFLLEQVK